MKTKEELKILKQEYESVASKLKELTEEELELVTGGAGIMPVIVQAAEERCLNPEDIESMTVLKDAATAAIYGSENGK